MKAWKHFRTITNHKMLVMKGCFQVGLYRQGLMHDMSKYSLTEFVPGCKYYQGFMSPNNAERKDKGYSIAWLHHKGRNKHHLEYCVYYAAREYEKEHGGMVGMKMPIEYVVEMFVDRVSASKNYQKKAYTDASALIYYQNSLPHYLIHEDTAALLDYLLTMLAKRGEKETFHYIKTRVLQGKVPYDANILKRRKQKL